MTATLALVPPPNKIVHLAGLPDGSLGIITRDPGECKSCHALTNFFVNRNGSTQCLPCDFKENL